MSGDKKKASGYDKYISWKTFSIPLGVLILLLIMPTPKSMIDMASKVDPLGYMLASGCRTITDNINKKLHPNAFEAERISHSKEHAKAESLLTPRQAARMAKVMLAIFFLAVYLLHFT
jgi:hypothetical protein